MKLRQCVIAFILVFFTAAKLAAQQYPDVLHYNIAVTINDSSDIIAGTTTIQCNTNNASQVLLDLVSKKENGKGMTVGSVTENNETVPFKQSGDSLILSPKPGSAEHNFTIAYNGIPADGLIISTNMFGQRTFFGDNWPNRAHNWFPCHDHLSDKATVDFYITAPGHYEVVANGIEKEIVNLPGNEKLTHYFESVPIACKVMVFGAADFAMQYVGNANTTPVYSWVYPQQKDSGFAHYAQAIKILPWFNSHVAPFAFEKLANVQSKTRFGGMENAGCIFYSETSVMSSSLEALMVHEIAHQWFGNSATEKDWPHLWLSEGFATYMTNVYHEEKYGKDSFMHRMMDDRTTVIRFSKSRNTPVVDTTAGSNLMQLLNANSYQKGGWILHMLRQEVGDTLFWKSVRTYYATYAGKNANTGDLEKIFEKVSGKQLADFFKQWCYTTGQPDLKISWQYNGKNKNVTIEILQLQENLFNCKLDIQLSNGEKKFNTTIALKDKKTIVNVSPGFMPESLIADPGIKLLFESTIVHGN